MVFPVFVAQLLPLQDRLLRWVEIGDLDLQAGVRDHGPESPGEGALAGPTLLRDEADDDGRCHGYSSNR